MIKRIAILTSGGDAPGMNTAIRCCIRSGLYYGKEMYVIYEGFKGLVEGKIQQVTKDFTKDLISRGGTILKSARFMEFLDIEVQKAAIQVLRDNDIDALIGIGGDGTFKGLKALADLGFPVIGVPATIDNDVACSEFTIGFHTALNTICECIDRIKDTSNSHQRCSIVEVMGRHCGDLALFAGIAEGAEMTVTADKPATYDEIIARLKKLKAQRKDHAVVVVSENLYDVRDLAQKVQEATGFNTKYEILGRLQRGGAPCAADKILAARLSHEAVRQLCGDNFNLIVATQKGHTVSINMSEALNMERYKYPGTYKLIDILQ